MNREGRDAMKTGSDATLSSRSFTLENLEQRVDDGARDRFLETVWPHFDSLQQTALYLVGQSDAAERSVQETYHRAWQRFGQGEHAGTIEETKGWLLAMLKEIVAKHVLQEAAADGAAAKGDAASVAGQKATGSNATKETSASSSRKPSSSRSDRHRRHDSRPDMDAAHPEPK